MDLQMQNLRVLAAGWSTKVFPKSFAVSEPCRGHVLLSCYVWNQPRRYDTVVWSASGKPGHPTRPVDAS